MTALRLARLNILISLSLCLIFFSQLSLAQVPSSFVYQGQILKNGSAPLEANPVIFRVQILSQVNDCVLFEEQHSINMLGSEGVFSLNIGAGIRSGSDFEDTSSLENIFRNNQNITGITTCGVGNSYNALSGHTRKMRISYNDGSGLVTLAQDFHMQATPFSWYANSLQGLTPANFVQVNPTQNLTQSNLETLLGGTNYTSLLALLAGTSPLYVAQGTNGANLPSFASNPPAPAAGAMWFDSTTNQVKFFDGTSPQVMGGGGAGTGTVTSVATGSGLTGGPITASGTISIATGGVTDTHLASGIDASKITTGTLPVGVVPSNTDTTKLPLSGGTMTGSVTMGASTNFAGFDLVSTGHMTMSAQRTLRLGSYTTTQQNDLITLTPLGVGHVGTTWYNSTTNKLMYWNGTAALEILDTVTAGTIGDITAVNTNAGSGLSGGVSTGAATLQIVTDNTGIEINGTNQLQLKDLGVTNAKLASDAVTSGKIQDGTIATGDIADSAITNQKINTVSPTKIVSGPAEYLTYEPAATACTAGQTLKWSATLPTGWICGNDNDTNTDAVTSVFTRTGAITAQSGDYTATQITNTASGNIVAINTQAAINELDSEKVAKAGDTISGALVLNGTLTTNAQVTSTSSVTLNAQNELRFADSDSSNYVALRSPATVGSNITWTLPSNDGATGSFLSTNGSGVLAWVAGNNGDITGVTAGSGLTGGGASGDVTVSVATGGITSTHINDGTIATIDIADNAITTAKILDANVTTAKIADSAITDAKIDNVSVDKIISGATKYFKYKPNNANCANLDTLKWNNALEQWECGSDNNGVTSVFTRTGAVTAQNGDYTATQITNTASGNISALTAQAAINELDSEKVAKSGDTMTGALTLNAQNEARFADSDSSNYVALRSPATVSANITWTLPDADGLNGTVLTTNGSGVLTWTTPSAATSVNASTGTAASPSISFTTEADTGFYNSNSNAIGVASGGFQTFEFNSTGLQSPNARGPLVATATGSATNPTYSFNGDPNTGWFSPAADTLAAATNGSERVRIDSSGNVGIGTTLPAEKLEVMGNINVGSVAVGTSGVYGNTLNFLGAATNTDALWMARYNVSPDVTELRMNLGDEGTDSLVIGYTSGVTWIPAMKMQANGNVGIGTSAPSHRFSVITNSPSRSQMQFGTTANEGGFLTSTSSSQAILSGGMYWNGTDWIAANASSSALSLAGGRIDFTLDSGNTIGSPLVTTTRMSILPSGNVGIGTTSPIRSLHVNAAASEASIVLSRADGLTNNKNWRIFSQNGGAGTAGNLYFDLLNDAGSGVTTSAMTILNTGNVGVGTTSPMQKIDVAGIYGVNPVASNYTDISHNLYYASGWKSRNGGSGSLMRMFGGSSADSAFVFYINNAVQATAADTALSMNEAMRIDKNGNVGVGTTNPLDKLQVVGDIRVGTSGSNGCLKDFGGGTITGTCSSDERLKHNFRILGPVSEKLKKITPKFYQWRGQEFPDKHFGSQEELGIVAQDLMEIFPELVQVDEDGFYRVRYQRLPFYLIKGFSEQQNTLNAHTEDINAIKAKNQKLELENIEIKRELASIKAKTNKEIERSTQVERELKAKNAELKTRLEKIERALMSK